MTTSTDQKPAATSRRRPANGKAPADRKPPQSRAKAPASAKTEPVVKREGDTYKITHRGVTATIDPVVLNDYELVIDMASGDLARIPSILHRLIGEQAHREVIEALRDPDTGRVPLEGEGSVAKYLEEIFGALNPNS